MRTVHKSALVSYSAREMFDLVNDIEAYPTFLPWCRDARVEHVTETEVHASLELARGGVHKWFTTRNEIDPGRVIDINLVNGPFRHLDGKWQFTPLGEEGSRVTLDMSFEFSSRMLSVVVGPVFHQICNSLVDAFVRRAADVYGRK